MVRLGLDSSARYHRQLRGWVYLTEWVCKKKRGALRCLFAPTVKLAIPIVRRNLFQGNMGIGSQLTFYRNCFSMGGVTDTGTFPDAGLLCHAFLTHILTALPYHSTTI